MKDHRLFMDMESGSTVTVDLSVKLKTMRFRELADEDLFMTAQTDGNYVHWGHGRLSAPFNELLQVVLMG